jgi:hypothetical protein
VEARRHHGDPARRPSGALGHRPDRLAHFT